MKKKDYRSCKGIARALGFAALAVAVLSAWGQRSLFKDTSRGLSDLNINTLTQDRAGFLWVGTENGLFRYDGFRFQRFGVEQGVGSRNIQNLFAAPDGTLWAGTASGIYFLRQDGSFAEVHPPPSLSQFSPRIGTVFAADAQNRVVVADRSGAYLLHKASPEQWIAEAMPLPAQEIWSLHFDARGALWYGCDSDLCTTDHGATQRMAAAAKLPAEHWQCIVEDGDGHLWLRGQQHLAEFFPREKRAELHDLPVPSKEHFSLTLSRNGKGQMVAAQGSALGIWENGHWRMVTERNGLEPNDISALFVDRQGLLWIGQVGHGLKRWVGEGQWSAYTVADGLSNNSVWSTLRDRAGRLWIGTESGLDWIPAGQSTPRAWQLKGISTAQAMALAQSGDGASWVGSRAGGVVRIEANGLRATAWKTPRVYRILADSQQRLWFATAGGLYMADTAHTRAAPRPVKDAAFSNPRQRITDLSLGAQLWAAAESGLYRLEGKQWRHIDTGLSGVIPMRIAADRQGNLWSAGNFPGLMRLRVVGGRVQEAEHIAHPPLLSDAINSLVVDHRGWLWMGQDAGLTLFDGKNWHSFSQNDGLLWNDCNASALSEDQDGSLWIGTSGGLAHLIDPVAVAPAPALLLSLSHATVGAVPLSNGAEILWRDNPLDLSFAALDFAHPQPSGIRYRLLGLIDESLPVAVAAA